MEPRLRCVTEGPHGTQENIVRLWNNVAPRFCYGMTEPHGSKEPLRAYRISVCRWIFCSLLECWWTIKPEAASHVSGCVISVGEICQPWPCCCFWLGLEILRHGCEGILMFLPLEAEWKFSRVEIHSDFGEMYIFELSL